jgi:hypothetical protein
MRDGRHSDLAALLADLRRAADLRNWEPVALATIGAELARCAAVLAALAARLAGPASVRQDSTAETTQPDPPAPGALRFPAPRCAAALSCACCGATLVGRRSHARYCSARCRAAASDARRREGDPQ